MTHTDEAHSDDSSPEKQSEQILAIYPILKGQKPLTKNIIPPRGCVSGSSIQEPHDPPPKDKGDDLIDFGQDDEAPPPAQRQPESKPQPEPEERPAIDPKHKSTAGIQSMLSDTGSTKSGGSLIDFHDDMKKNLPSSLKREDTTESNDEFVDALE